VKVGLDLDGVVFDFVHGFSLFLHDHYGAPVIRSEEATAWYWHADVGLTEAQWHEGFAAFSAGGGFRGLELRPGAWDGVWSLLAAGHEIQYVSARRGAPRADTVQALVRNRLPPGPLRISEHKGRAVRELGLDVFVDDRPANVLEVLRAGARTFVMDLPYNRCDLPAEIVRVAGWRELLERIGVPWQSCTRSAPLGTPDLAWT
jgi:uncharacterized HAD superfamily protein